MKITKKNFEPNLEVVVNDKPFTFANAIINELEGYLVQDITDLDLWHGRSKFVVFKKGDILLTHKFVNHQGSPRCIFKKKGEVQLYQAFWNDFSKLTDLI